MGISKKLTALLLGVIGIIGSARGARADTVTASASTPSPALVVSISVNDPIAHVNFSNVNAYAGLINWTVSAHTGATFANISTYGTFCVDIAHLVQVGHSYTYNVLDGSTAANTHNLYTLGGFAELTTTKAAAAIANVERLYFSHYHDAIASNAGAAEFQLSIWKLIYGSEVSYNAPSLASTVTAWTAAAQVTGGGLTYLDGLKSTSGAQDQGIVPAQHPAPNITPIPASLGSGLVLLSLLGFSGLGGKRRQLNECAV